MAFFDDKVAQQVKAALADLASPVTLKVFTQEFECDYCKETRTLAEEVAAQSPKVTVEVYDFVKDKALADSLGIDKIPAMAVVGAKDYGIRLFGVPAGYEFTTLIEAIKLAGSGESGLSAENEENGGTLDQANDDPGVRDTYVPILPARCESGAPAGCRERPDQRAYGRGERVSAPGDQVQRDGRPPYCHQRHRPCRRRCS